MQFKSVLLAMSLIAFTGTSAYADDATKNKSDSHAKSPASQSSSAKSSGISSPRSASSGSASSGGSTGASAGAAAHFDFDKADKNKDGQLSRAEFLAAAPQASALTANLQKTVTALDANKDGRVTADEFRAPQLSLFDRLDTNKDGVLTLAERQAARKPK
jgi:EF-hand domain pair/EF hand